MSWVKVDDKFTEHPKSVSVGPLGIAMQVAALCYANTHLTDGFIPYNVVRKLLTFEFSPPNNDIIYTISITSGMQGEDVTWEVVSSWLVDAEIWERVEGGFYIHDYPDYQPLKASVLKEREEAQRRMNKIRSVNVRPNKERTNPEVRPKFNDPDPDPEPLKKEEEEPPGSLISFSKAFVDATSIPENTTGPQSWYEPLKVIKDAGCTPEDIKKAVFNLRNATKEYVITSPRSIVNATLNVMSQRKNPPTTSKGKKSNPEELPERSKEDLEKGRAEFRRLQAEAKARQGVSP